MARTAEFKALCDFPEESFPRITEDKEGVQMLGNEHSQCNKPLNEAKFSKKRSGMLWAALDFQQANKHVSAWLTRSHVCIPSMTGYTCCKALAGTVCHWAVRSSPECTERQSENIKHETGDIFQVQGFHFTSKIK